MKSKFILASAMLLSTAAFAQSNVSTEGQKHPILFEGTGAWCQHCSDGAVFVENVLAASPKAIAVSVHNGDGMAFSDGNTFNSAFATGYPYGTVDAHFFGMGGDTTVGINRGKWQAAVDEQLTKAPDYDITMSHSYDKATKTITVNVTGKALKALTGQYNFNVYVVEDSVVGPDNTQYNQINANSYNNNPSHKYYNKGNTIKFFQHEQVLRAMMGGTWGVSAATSPAANSSVTKTFTYVLPDKYDVLNVKIHRLKLVAVVQKALVGAPKNNKNADVLNAVEAVFNPWSTGINEVSNFADLQLYPNPASDVLYVRANLNTPAATTISITNSIGQVVYNNTFKASGNLVGETINVSNLNSGLYFVSVSSNGSTRTEKLTINK